MFRTSYPNKRGLEFRFFNGDVQSFMTRLHISKNDSTTSASLKISNRHQIYSPIWKTNLKPYKNMEQRILDITHQATHESDHGERGEINKGSPVTAPSYCLDTVSRLPHREGSCGAHPCSGIEEISHLGSQRNWGSQNRIPGRRGQGRGRQAQRENSRDLPGSSPLSLWPTIDQHMHVRKWSKGEDKTTQKEQEKKSCNSHRTEISSYSHGEKCKNPVIPRPSSRIHKRYCFSKGKKLTPY